MPVGTLEHSPLSILQVLSRMGGSMVANTQSGRNRYQQIAAYPPLRITMSSSDKEVLADNSLSCHGSWLNIKMWAIYDWPKCTIERKGGRVRYLIPLMSQVMKLRGALKKNFFWGKFSQMWEPIHPRVFVGFGKTKGEIRVKKRDFRGNLGGWLRGLDLVWESATPPTHIFLRPSLTHLFMWEQRCPSLGTDGAVAAGGMGWGIWSPACMSFYLRMKIFTF